MNKSEKLLAARKKLKEFQLHKSNHEQEGASNPSQRDKITTYQDNDMLSDQNRNIYNNENNSIGVTAEQSNQTHCDSTNSNNVISIENSESPDSFTYLTEENKIILNKKKEMNSDIQENYQTILTNEEKLTANFLQKEISSEESEIKISETVNLSNFNSVLDDSKSSKTGEFENSADFFDSANTVENFTASAALNNYANLEKQAVTTFFNVNYDIQQLQVTQLHARIDELENLLSQKNIEYNDELVHQINSLKEEIQMHRQTAGILVTEKADLCASLQQYQKIAQQKSDEVGEIHKKLKYTIDRMTNMEKDFIAIKNNAEDNKMLNDKLANDYEKLNQKCLKLKEISEEQQLESAELRQELNIKKTELMNLQQKMEESKNLLSLAELKIQQLTSVPQQLDKIENQQETEASLKQQLSHLHESLRSINIEKEEMCNHYESYVKQLNTKYEETVQELNIAKRKIREFSEREESLIQRLSLMEQQYQREKQRVDSLLPLQAHEEKINYLTKSLDSLVLEQENLQQTLHEKQAETESMKVELQELRELRDQSVEISKLVTALESEQLGASRAVSQNQQLKLQLNEMHDAFVTLSNSKLNLTEQLQDERAVGRKLNAEYGRIEAERDKLKEELNRKNAIIEELEKDKLHFAQLTDQMQHYQVQSNQSRTLQQELQNALSTIEKLKNENQSMIKNPNNPEQSADSIHTEYENFHIKYPDNTENSNSAISNVNEQEPSNKLDQLQNNSYNALIENQKKLESRFKDTMERVAELTDEKQRLEHLVLQLQGETETIGEYITLYQKQRSILQMKAQEKERIFNQLLNERNQQQAQLHQMKNLVAELLAIDGHISTPSAPDQHNPSNTLELNEYLSVQHENTDTDIATQTSQKALIMDNKNETASKILELLTEIKDCKDTCSMEPNVHHCIWCSGKLITV